jgi:hypothetical protein
LIKPVKVMPMRKHVRTYSFRKKPLSYKRLFLMSLCLLAGLVLLGYFLAPKAPEAVALPTKERPRLANVQSTAATKENITPQDLSVRSILEDVLSLWTKALLTGDYKEFHKSLATPWKAQDSPEKLASTYKSLSEYKDSLERFPGRGKLVLLESAPFKPGTHESPETAVLRENVGPESPWLVRGEWRTGKTALNFTLILSLDSAEWKPVGLRVEIYERSGGV